MEFLTFISKFTQVVLIVLIGTWAFRQAVFLIEGKEIKNPFKTLENFKKKI